MDQDWKEATRQAFNGVSAEYAARDAETLPETAEVAEALEEFFDLVTPSGSVLDIGTGGGRDSRYFHAHGLAVTGIDFAEDMLEKARAAEPEIEYLRMDFEELGFPPSSFDGVWANASLHHVPKERLPAVLAAVWETLKPQGVFFIKVKHGDADGLRENEKFGKTLRRYFAFYETDELRQLLDAAGFSVIGMRETTRGEWLDAFAQKD